MSKITKGAINCNHKAQVAWSKINSMSKNSKPPKIKLSPKHKEVVRLMREGWQLAAYRAMFAIIGCRIQKGGIGSGGRGWKVNMKTIEVLCVNGIVIPGETTQVDIIYKLTKIGKTIQL